MGLFGKIKNIFYDIEEVEVPITKEEKEVEKPKIEELNIEEKIEPTEVKVDNNLISERELFKSKNTFNFPIFEADEDEQNEPIINEQKKPEVISRVRENTYYEEPRREVRFEKPVEAPKQSRVFTPSPVISPVYGILDKNYKKEVVIEKREPVTSSMHSGKRNYDYVRSKAFGTLEDEIENTLTHLETNKSTIELTQDLTESIEKIEQSSKNIEDLLAEVEKPKVTVEEMEERYKDRIEKEEKEDSMDNTLEHDLFNLIDSMYDNKEE